MMRAMKKVGVGFNGGLNSVSVMDAGAPERDFAAAAIRSTCNDRAHLGSRECRYPQCECTDVPELVSAGLRIGIEVAAVAASEFRDASRRPSEARNALVDTIAERIRAKLAKVLIGRRPECETLWQRKK